MTEMPKALFKKPKVKDYSSNVYGVEKLLKPLFPNRSNAKRHKKYHSQGKLSARGISDASVLRFSFIFIIL